MRAGRPIAKGSTLLTLLAVALLIVSASARADTSFAERVADFDSRWFGLRTELSGDMGALNGDCVTVERDVERGCLSLRYDFSRSADNGAYAGAWMSLRGPIGARHVRLDLSAWDSLRFRVLGQATVLDGTPQGKGPGCNLRVEVKDDRRDYKSTAYRYIRVEPGPEWSEILLSARIDDPRAWRFNAGPPDPARAKELVLVIEQGLNEPRGRLCIDDFDLLGGKPETGPPPADDDAMLGQIARATFGFFWDYADPKTGLMVDRSSHSAPFTIAGTGFALGAYCIGAERGYVTRDQAAGRVRTLLTTLASSPVGDCPVRCSRYRGFFYHFLDASGYRDGIAELSTIDTALLMCGVLTCKGYFDGDSEADVRRTAQYLVDEVDWPWMVAPDGLFRHGWKPDGDMRAKWDTYTDEILLLDLLAVGSGTHPVPADTFHRWQRVPVESAAGELIASFSGSLFTYTFASLWLPPRVLDRPDPHPTQPVDWWRNSRVAAEANLAYCRSRPELFGGRAWGLTACLGRVGDATVYHAYSAPPALEVRDGRLVRRDVPHAIDVSGRWVDDNTVVAPYGAASALPLLPGPALEALRYYRGRPELWHSADCGLADAYSEIDGYVNPEAYSIDAGPMLLAIDNYRAMQQGVESTVWRAFSGTAEVRRAVERIWRGRNSTAE